MHPTAFTMITTLRRGLAAVLIGLLATSLPAIAQGLGPNGLPLNPDAAPQARVGTKPSGSSSNAGSSLDELMAWERQDMGVRAPQGLHAGAMHGPTPNQIAGGQVITTKGLLPLLRQREMPVHVIDVLGDARSLPRAVPAAWAAQAGSFDDETQQQLAQMLRQLTRGSNDTPLVFYCAGPECWMSYNAAVRAIRLGYRNVVWYRGGLEAWQRAGLPLAQAGWAAR